MAIEQGPYLDVSIEAAADLRTKQYHLVEQNTSTGKVDVCNAPTDKPIGVLQNKPNAGQTADVRMFGISKVVADANLAIDDLIGTSADGQAAAKVPGTDITHFVIGRVIGENTVAGGIITAAINCMSPARAT